MSLDPADQQRIDFVGALADCCRKHGVKMADVNGIRVELGPLDGPMKPDKPAAEDCPCGHGLHAHNGGLCLFGCSIEKCAGPEVTA